MMETFYWALGAIAVLGLILIAYYYVVVKPKYKCACDPTSSAAYDYSKKIKDWKTLSDCSKAPKGVSCQAFQGALCAKNGGCANTRADGKGFWCYACN